MILLGTIAENLIRAGLLAALCRGFFLLSGPSRAEKRTLRMARNSYHLATLFLIAAAGSFLYLIVRHQFM